MQHALWDIKLNFNECYFKFKMYLFTWVRWEYIAHIIHNEICWGENDALVTWDDIPWYILYIQIMQWSHGFNRTYQLRSRCYQQLANCSFMQYACAIIMHLWGIFICFIVWISQNRSPHQLHQHQVQSFQLFQTTQQVNDELYIMW